MPIAGKKAKEEAGCQASAEVRVTVPSPVPSGPCFMPY